MMPPTSKKFDSFSAFLAHMLVVCVTPGAPDAFCDEGLELSPAGYVRNLDFVVQRSGRAWSYAQQQSEPLGTVSKDYQKLLLQVLEHVLGTTREVTAALELFHIDPGYRDAYYHYYSNKFFDVLRHSVRVSLFAGRMSARDVAMAEEERLQDAFLGAVVVDPVRDGLLGRTLMAPRCLVDGPVRVRLSRFDLTVLGRRLHVRAFPSRMQDGEVMRCAEVSLLNLMSYYSNEYSAYADVLPSDILALEEKYAHERVVPSKGLDYQTFTKLLAEFGFYPRLYNAGETALAAWSGLDKRTNFQRLLHWYVDSGIPVAVNVVPKASLKNGHSVVCIGYESPTAVAPAESGASLPDGAGIPADVLDKAYLLLLGGTDGGRCKLIQTADLYSRYVVIDDGCVPYSIASFPRLSPSFPEMEAEYYAVPLHRGMALDAMDAYDDFISILSVSGAGLATWGAGVIGDGDIVAMRMFLASARSYKRFRVKTNDGGMGMLYQQAILPHFVWVAELFMARDCFVGDGERLAFAEVVLDSTSAESESPVDKIVLMRYPGHMLLRSPAHERFEDSYFGPGSGESWPVQWSRFEPYAANLAEVMPGSCESAAV